MYVCFSHIKKSFKNIKFSLKMLYPVERSRERCASNNLSHDSENLFVAAFYTPILSFWERPYSREGNKLAVVLVM